MTTGAGQGRELGHGRAAASLVVARIVQQLEPVRVVHQDAGVPDDDHEAFGPGRGDVEALRIANEAFECAYVGGGLVETTYYCMAVQQEFVNP